MPNETASLVERLNLLGLKCDDAPGDRLNSATTALCCFPMYMVANVHAWTRAEQWAIPLVDVPGWQAIRESFAIGRQEKHLEISTEHRHLLGTLLRNAKPSDRIIYEYALETLVQFFDTASEIVVQTARTAVAKMIVAVANASGEGLLGTGEKVNRQEYDLIRHICERLNLNDTPAAKEELASLED